MKNFKRKAFTLVELLVVIAIIGILFVVLISKVDFATEKSKASGVQTDFRSYQLAIETVARENAGLSVLVNNEASGEEKYAALETALNKNLDPKLHVEIDADGKISTEAKDPWKEQYLGAYLAPDADGTVKDRGAIVMYCKGSNLKLGSTAEISNGVVNVTIESGKEAEGADDYAISTIYTYVNGYGEIKTTTKGFSNDMGEDGVAEGNSTPANPSDPADPDTPDDPAQGGADEEDRTPVKNKYGFYYDVPYVAEGNDLFEIDYKFPYRYSYLYAIVFHEDGTAVVLTEGDRNTTTESFSWELSLHEFQYNEDTQVFSVVFETLVENGFDEEVVVEGTNVDFEFSKEANSLCLDGYSTFVANPDFAMAMPKFNHVYQGDEIEINEDLGWDDLSIVFYEDGTVILSGTHGPITTTRDTYYIIDDIEARESEHVNGNNYAHAIIFETYDDYGIIYVNVSSDGTKLIADIYYPE